MIVPFPFTFKLTVPGLTNPFAISTESTEPTDLSSESESVNSLPHQLQSEPNPVRKPRQRLPSSNRPRPTSPPAPITRKRGWDPSLAERSASSATLASTSGYLETPSKLPEMAANSGSIDNDTGLHEDDLPPPAKRRRGLAGSIVSTAVSAALIGTAVGLTVYRLWRDRGKILPPQPVLQEQEQEQIPPPPPYEQGEWKSEKEPTSAVKPTPSTPRSRRPRAAHVSTSAKRSSVRRPRRHPPTSYHAASQPVLPPSRPEFDFTPDQEDDPELDQMDWIGDKLAQLIEEGKRALKSEVVVMSESKDDEVDDGSGAWEEETTVPVQTSSMKSLSRSSSRAKRRNTHIPVATPYSSSSPRKSAFDLSLPSSSSSMAPVPITPKQRGRSVDLPLGASFTEDGNAWESPELRESMERARARFLATRNRGV